MLKNDIAHKVDIFKPDPQPFSVFCPLLDFLPKQDYLLPPNRTPSFLKGIGSAVLNWMLSLVFRYEMAEVICRLIPVPCMTFTLHRRISLKTEFRVHDI
jgi:hypothetical protein